MRKQGKPNTFFKGMKVDMSPGAQPKDSYRYAKNIRLVSFEGKNVSMQPYDSDRLTLTLSGSISKSDVADAPDNLLTGLTNSLNDEYGESAGIYTTQGFFDWSEQLTNVYYLDLPLLFTGDASGIGLFDASNIANTISIDSAINVGEIYQGFLEYFIETNPILPVGIYLSGIGENTSDNISVQYVVTITMSDESTISLEVPIPPMSDVDSNGNTDNHLENLIVNAINSDISNGLSVYINTLGPYSGYQCAWTFQNIGQETYVTNFQVDIQGSIIVNPSVSTAESYNLAEVWLQSWQDWSSEIYGGGVLNFLDGDIETIGYAIEQSYLYFVQQTISNNTESSEFDISTTLIDTEITEFNYDDADIPDATQVDMQILGHYAFSDYLVLLGKWIGPDYISTAYTTGPKDFVIKVSQKRDGTLAQPGVIDSENPYTEDDIFQLFFLGDLGFSDKKKLKVVGSEENEYLRRIYFTDGEMPLRTMNVGANPVIYSNHIDNAGFFDLFVEANLSIPKITGFEEGGSLDSIGHAYCFRYKTKDGRISRMSPVCNPGSVPVTNKGTEAAFSKGGNANENSGKSIKGVIENLDKRFPFIELIHVPYIAGVPGVAQVINTMAIPDTDGVNHVEWIHTGSETIDKEILVEEFGTDNVTWDVCQALEVKDNRLFCGNLKGTNLTIDTDFTVVSYNKENRHHSYETGNPHLYHDLLYSQGGLDFDDEGTNPEVHVGAPSVGRYAEPFDETGNYMYRYIKMTNDEVPAGDDALFSGNFTAPQYWEEENTIPSEYEAKRGIFGAESKYFNTPLEEDGNQYEGVRVTFRVLGAGETPASAIQLDKDNKLITSGNFSGARAPFYKLDSNVEGGYYANYANPYYNSNYVGYRRGEIYRFGILFYDKKGSPMFVKRIGDIRMPEHSTEYIVPEYSGSGSSGIGISGVKTEWPFYYQTSRSDLDGGFADWPGKDWDYYEGGQKAYQKPYSDHATAKGEGQYGCILYPYFEIKLSADTCKKVSGYQIVRVERTSEHRTVSTSGILQRAVHYADNHPTTLWNGFGQMTSGDMVWWGSNRVEMDGRYGNDPIPLWTNTIQEYRSHKYGNPGRNYDSDGVAGGEGNVLSVASLGGDDPIGGHQHWTHSNIFTMDSPDAIINPNFALNFSSGDRIKITESRYCVKQNVSNGGNTGLRYPSFLNHYLSEGNYPGSSTQYLPSTENPDFRRQAYSVSLFSCLIATDLLEGDDITYQGEVVNFGGWNHRTAAQWYAVDGGEMGWHTDWHRDWNAFDARFRGVNSSDDANWYNDADLPNIHNNFVGSWYRLGIYSKYYSKRVGSYPMYGMARPDWNKYHQNGSVVSGTGEGFSMNCRDITYADKQYTPQFLAGNVWPDSDGTTQDAWYGFLGLDNNDEFYGAGARATNVLPDIIARAHNDFGEGGELLGSYVSSVSDGFWNESNLTHASIISPGEEVSAAELGSDRPFKNATMWHDFCAYNRKFSLNSTVAGANIQYGSNVDGDGGGSGNDQMDVYTEHTADYVLSNRTIVMSLPHHAMLPITRHCLQKNNWRERIFWQFGGCNVDQNFEIHTAAQQGTGWGESGSTYGATGGGSTWSQYSPEVTMASIVKKKDSTTMYGGNSSIAFAKNSFIATGCFQQVDVDTGGFSATGNNGNHVFGGDTYICNFSLKKTNDPETIREYDDPSGNPNDYAEMGVLTAYTCPVETETNLDLRHGLFFGGDTQNIPKQLEDDYGSISYNPSYDSENTIQLFTPKPVDFIEVDHWPSTVAWSEPKFPGDFSDSYSLFPVGQIKDLDYAKGRITQMFKVQNDLFALQNSGTCKLSVNPRIMIPSGEGGHISTITGTDSVIERYDYISESWGSQHFHGLAVSDRAAYFYDDNASKFIKLGRGQGGGWGVSSLGDSLGMQTHFQKYHNITINDNPLNSYDWSREEAGLGLFSPTSYWSAVSSNPNNYYRNVSPLEKGGGISIGYDPEYGEILLTIFAKETSPETIVYSEPLDVFTSFTSKRPVHYINFKNRLYCTYFNTYKASNSIYLSNGYSNYSSADMQTQISDDLYGTIFKYLNFGDVDYYIFGEELPEEDSTEDVSYELDSSGYNTPIITPFVGDKVDTLGYNVYNYHNIHPEEFGVMQEYKKIREPIQIQFVANDESNQSKVFDNLDINMESHTYVGQNYLYFRKFAFKGSANLFGIHEFDMSEYTFLTQNEDNEDVYQYYSNALNGFNNDPGRKMWYSVKEGTHHVPFKATGIGKSVYHETPGILNKVAGEETVYGDDWIEDPTCRGNYAIVSMVMGWDEGVQFFGAERITHPFPTTEAPFQGVSIVPKNEHFSILSVTPYYRYSRR